MLPGIYDFHWDAGHIIFLGIFYTVLMIVASTIVIALRRAIRDFRGKHTEAARVQWLEEFEELPDEWRRCRHEMTGETPDRICPNAFDCRACTEHPKFLAARRAGTLPEIRDRRIAGFEVPADRLYHRGHTWARQEQGGFVTVGLDDLAAHLIGRPDRIRLPRIGTHVAANGTAWQAEKGGVSVRVLSPVDGEVVEVGGPDKEWYLKVRPDGEQADLRHLLTVTEAKQWMLREAERLQTSMALEGVGAALADGGVPVDDLTAAIPADRRDDVLGMMFLNA